MARRFLGGLILAVVLAPVVKIGKTIWSDKALIASLPVYETSFDQLGAKAKASVDVLFKDTLQYCEDVVLDHKLGVAFLSCDPGRTEWNTVMGTMYDPNPKGSMYYYDYKHDSIWPIELVGLPETSDFHPLGINFYYSGEPNTPYALFVVNHQRNGSTVDIFSFSHVDHKAHFVSSISDGDNNILSPNAIYPLDHTTFYLTNDHKYIPRLSKIANFVETFTPLKLSWVTLVDIKDSDNPKFTTVAESIGFANGLVVTPKEVIVAACSERLVHVYDRDSTTNLLTYRRSIPVPMNPDNLSFDSGTFDADGRFLSGLVVAGHPAPSRLMALSRKRADDAPSMVFHVNKGPNDAEYHLDALFVSNGTFFSSSSTGAVDWARRTMLVSGLYARGLLKITWDL